MTKVNQDFIKAMQLRLDMKDGIYKDKKNYKNMHIGALISRLNKTILNMNSVYHEEDYLKELVDVANFCWMIWERVKESEVNNV
jgi:hypothetical protein